MDNAQTGGTAIGGPGLAGHVLTLPFYKELEGARSILVAGAGGGFDIFCGLPLYFGLRQAGRRVHLANLSFSHLRGSSARELAPGLFEVAAGLRGASVWGGGAYFPELYLARWLASREGSGTIYGFGRSSRLSRASLGTTMPRGGRPAAHCSSTP